MVTIIHSGIFTGSSTLSSFKSTSDFNTETSSSGQPSTVTTLVATTTSIITPQNTPMITAGETATVFQPTITTTVNPTDSISEPSLGI